MWVLRAKQLWLTTPSATKSPVPVVMSNSGCRPTGVTDTTASPAPPVTGAPPRSRRADTAGSVRCWRRRNSGTPPSSRTDGSRAVHPRPGTGTRTGAGARRPGRGSRRRGAGSAAHPRSASAAGVDQPGQEAGAPVVARPGRPAHRVGDRRAVAGGEARRWADPARLPGDRPTPPAPTGPRRPGAGPLGRRGQEVVGPAQRLQPEPVGREDCRAGPAAARRPAPARTGSRAGSPAGAAAASARTGRGRAARRPPAAAAGDPTGTSRR